MSKHESKSKLITPQFLCLFTLALLNGLTFYIIGTVIVKYAVSLGCSLTVSGIISGSYSLAALFFQPLVGQLCDRLNNKGLIIVALLCTIVAISGYMLATNLALLILFRVIHGIGFVLCMNAITSFAVQFIPPDRLGEGVGYIGLTSVLSGAIGPSMAIWLQELSFHALFLTTIIIEFLAVLLLCLSKMKDQRTLGKFSFVLKFSEMFAIHLLFYGMCNGVISASNSLFTSYLVLHLESRHILNIGVFFTVSSLAMLAIRPVAGRATDKSSGEAVVLVSMVAMAASLFLIAKAWAFPIIIAAALFKAIGQGAGQPALQAICLKKAEENRRGVALSTWYLGADIGQGVAPMIGGYVSEKAGYGPMYSFMGIILLVFAVGLIGYTHLNRRRAIAHNLERSN